MIVFMLLMVEIVSFVILSLPLPLKVRRAILNAISNSPFAGRVKHVLKITIICILILFADSVRRVVRVTKEYDLAIAAPSTTESARSGYKASQFYAQRNLYLCGSALFLSLVVNRYYLALEAMVAAQDKMQALQTQVEASTNNAKAVEELETLRTKLETRDKEYETLAEKYAAVTKTVEKKKDI